jgi:hypothetical protein
MPSKSKSKSRSPVKAKRGRPLKYSPCKGQEIRDPKTKRCRAKKLPGRPKMMRKSKSKSKSLSPRSKMKNSVNPLHIDFHFPKGLNDKKIKELQEDFEHFDIPYLYNATMHVIDRYNVCIHLPNEDGLYTIVYNLFEQGGSWEESDEMEVKGKLIYKPELEKVMFRTRKGSRSTSRSRSRSASR